MANEPARKSNINTKKHVARLQRERRQSRIILYVFIGILSTVVLLLIYGFLDINYNLPTGKYDLIVVRTDVANPGVNLYTETLLDVFTIINPDGFILCKVFGDLNMNKIFDPNEPLIFPKYFIHIFNTAVDNRTNLLLFLLLF